MVRGSREALAPWRCQTAVNRRVVSMKRSHFLVWAVCGVVAGLAPGRRTSLEAQDLNLALGKEVSASGEVWSGQIPEHLTDGDYTNQTHPVATTGTLGFTYEIDLELEQHLDRIVISNRLGCCPERLSNYRVELRADNNGAVGAVRWRADIRVDGSNSGDGGKDVLRANLDPTGTFEGRFLRIINISNAAYNPQMAEVEAYAAPVPVIESFTVDHGNITRIGDPGLPASATLRWSVRGFEAITLSPGPGAVSGPTGELAVSPASTTVYTLTASNANGAVSSQLTVGVDEPTLPPVLTEFLASNDKTLEDEDGDQSDWIEIHNPNPFQIDLAGYRLTDDSTLQEVWSFPSAPVPASGYLVVFASGKDRRVPGQPLHTSFELRKDGDYLAFLAPSPGAVITQYPEDFPGTSLYPPQRKDLSYGRGSDGRTGFQADPSPGAPNGTTFEGFVEDTSFFPDRGFQDGPVDVTIATPTPGAQIRYTTDGSDPSPTHGSAYGSPVRVSSTRALRAMAFKEGYVPTNIDTHTYIFLDGVIASSVMSKSITEAPAYAPQMREALLDLPSMSFVTRSTINGTSEVPLSVEWIEPDGTPGFQIDAGVKNYGGAFTNFAKKNFRLYFRGNYGSPRLKHPIFRGFDHGIGAAESFDQLELRGGSHDMVERGFYMSNIFTDDSMLDMGNLNPHGRFVHLYINGTYWGVFHLRERWGADLLAQYLGGSKSDYESINGNWNVGGWADPGSAYDGDGSAWERIKSLRSNYAAVREYLDVPHYTDYMLLFFMGDCEQEYRCSGPRGPGSGFKFLLNDADGFLRAAGNRTSMGKPGRLDGDGPGSIFSMLFASGDAEYRTLLADRIQKHFFATGALTPAANRSRLLGRTAQLERPFLAESARWSYRTPLSWAQARDSYVGNVIPTRTGTVVSQLRGAGLFPTLEAPTLNQHGGPVPAGFIVSASAPQGTILYTLDGTDPRLPGGSTSPLARPLTSGLVRTPLVGESSRVAALVPADSSVGNAWRSWGFVETGWRSGTTGAGVGYDDAGGSYGPYIDLDVGAQMRNINPTVYVRYRFLVSQPASVTRLELRLRFDDGYIAYLNGTRIASRNAPDTPEWNSAATANRDDNDAVIPELASFTHEAPQRLLRTGENVLALQGLNTSAASGDLLLEAELVAISGDAGEEVSLERSTLWKSRTRLDGRWSGLNEAVFGLDTSPLRITEILYHPPPAPAGSPFSADDFELIELQNIGDRALNLTGVTLGEGVQFTFPDTDAAPEEDLAPGEIVLVVRNLEAFASVQDVGRLRIAGEYRGQLDNGGERLVLRDRLGQVLADFSYSDTWFSSTDGGGASLEVVDQTVSPEALNNAASWRASSTTGGTPGAAPPLLTGRRQRPGDANRNGSVEIGDAIALLFALFVEPVPLPCGGAPGDPGNRTLLDWNGDSRVDASDAILTLDHLFRGGPAHVLGTGCVEVQGCPALCGG